MKWVFITGISSGVGKTVAEKLLVEGYSVIGTSRTRPDDLEEKKNMHWICCDFSRKMKFDDIAAKVSALTNELDCVILNAGM